NRLCVAFLCHHLDHLLLLFLAILQQIHSDVSNEANTCCFGGRGATFAVFDVHAVARLDAENLASVQVDGRVGLAGGRVQGGGGTEDTLVGEVLHHICL